MTKAELFGEMMAIADSMAELSKKAGVPWTTIFPALMMMQDEVGKAHIKKTMDNMPDYPPCPN